MKLFIGILLGIILILINFRLIVFNENFYYDNSVKIDFSKEYVNNLISYFKGNTELNTKFFNERERLHLSDVRNLIIKTNYLLYFLIIGLILLMIKFYRELPLIFITSFGLILVLIGIFYLIGFSNLFYKFHLLAFNNDLWLLDPKTDNLVNIFPENFFLIALKKIITRAFFSSLALACSGLIFLKIKKNFSIL